MEKYEINLYFTEFNQKLKDLEKALEIDVIENKIKEIETKIGEPNFWDEQDKASYILKQVSSLKEKLQRYNYLNQKYLDIVEWEKISEENTEEWEILENDINILKSEIDDFSIQTLLNGEYDDCNAIVEIHPGAGGTEAQDWCQMLFGMYQKYASSNSFKLEVLDILPGEEAGLKSVTFMVSGNLCYGYLKGEIGVHRLVRISPFDANKKRHTSFASVMVTPEINETNEIELKDEDIKIDVYRSGGAGGQSVNTTDSAVRITHIPTGIVVTCQNERSQIKNRETAKKYLISKLVQLKMKEEQEKLANLQGKKMTIGWGSQIRSYVFQPYQMVKDHRTNYETAKLDDVFNGNLNDFINEYLKWSYEEEK